MQDQPEVTDWARELAGELLNADASQGIAWTCLPAANAAVPGDPWVRQVRASVDGDAASVFWCSLPRGERKMGTLQSSAFDLPARLTFFTAGHNGITNQPETPRNFIRLRDARTGELLAEAKPPRHDVARPVEWDLTQHAGKRGYLELVDGFDAPGYAWLAVGRFSLAALNADEMQPQMAALELIAEFRLQEFRPQLQEIVRSSSDIVLRRKAAETLLAFAPDARLAALLSDATDPASLQIALQLSLDLAYKHEAQASVSERSEKKLIEALSAVMLRAPREAQRRLAETLAGDALGGEALLQLAASGKASARLLTDPAIRARLAALKLEAFEERVASITASLPSENEELLKLIDTRRQQFNQTQTSAETGAALFQKNCAACHQLAGKGEKIGPQLDGIGGRGLARLIEDVLDPNRNVDPAFRITTLVLTDGRVLTGLVRRTEGQTLVLADNKGKEQTVPLSDIEERQPTALSLMPANYGELLSAPDFANLLAYLLSQQLAVARE
jgi:putative heme-binding domain-containing protein